MKKRLLAVTSVLLVCCMLFTAFPVAAATVGGNNVGASSGTTGDCTWTLYNGTLTISGNGAMGNYTFNWSSSLGHYLSTAPWGCNITSVIINDGVTSIGSSSFVCCTGLRSVTIPHSITKIDDGAFLECTGLTNVYISDLAAWCGIAFVSRSSNPLYFAQNLYLHNQHITDLIIPDGVASIESFAFEHFTGLTSIIIPNSVTSIGDYAFMDCENISDVYYGGNKTQWNRLVIGDGNDYLTSATIHYGALDLALNIPDDAVEFNGHYYKAFNEKLTWEQAKQYCESLGGHLATVTGTEEELIIESIANERKSYWLGATDKAQEGTWKWVTNEEWSYTKWNSRQPDDEHNFRSYHSSTGEDYLCYVINYGWNDSINDLSVFDNTVDATTVGFICEWDGDSTGTLTPVNINSGSSSQSNSVSVKTANNSTLDIELEKDLEFTVPSNVPLIGGGEMKLDLSFVPITAAITDNKIRIGIGYNRDLTKDTDEQAWCNWKNYVQDYKDDASKGKGLFNDINTKKKGIASAAMDKELDFEVYGYFEGAIQNGQVIGSGNLKIKLEGELSKEWQTAIAFVPIVLKVKGKVGVENTASLSLNFSTKELSFTNQLDITLPEITASAGVGIAHIADLSVYGEAKNVFSIYANPKKVTGTLFGEIGVSAKAFVLSGKLPVLSAGNGSGWTYYDSSRKSGSAMVGAFGYDDLDFTIDRSYLKKQSGWLSGKSKASDLVGSSGYDAFTYTALQTSIYDGAAPKLVKTDDDMILVWIGDDQTRSDGNQTVVYYSVFDSGSSTWNAPVAVEDNGTADFTPALVTDGENTYLAWTDAKTTFDGNAEMSEVAAACEIKLAQFNAITKTFDNIVQLTDNNTLDISPNLAVQNGAVSVVWKNNSANVFIENAGTETVYKATKTAEGFVTNSIYSSPNKIYELITDGENTAVSVDGDGDLNNAADSEIFVIDTQNAVTRLTDNTSGENDLAFSNINGQTMLTYLCDGTLYGSADLETVAALSAADTMMFGKYQFVGNKLFSVEGVEGSAEIFSYSTDEEGLWSNPVQVSFTEKYIRHPAFVDNNGEINCVFLNTAAVITEDDVTETTDLCTSVIPDFHNIEITDISYDGAAVIPGESLPITIALRNSGTVNENAFHVSIMDESGSTVANTTISKEIKSGQTAELTAEIPLDSAMNAKTTYTVTVNGTNCDDSEELSVGYTQLMLSTKTGIQDDTLGVLLNITNDSAIPTDARLVVKASENAEEALDIFVLGNIGANTSLNYYLNNEKICAYKAQSDSLYLELVSGKDEISLADNTVTVGLSSFSQYQLGDMNADGSVSIGDVTAVQRWLVELETFSDEQIALSDVNGDGEINVSDATHLQMYLAQYEGIVLG